MLPENVVPEISIFVVFQPDLNKDRPLHSNQKKRMKKREDKKRVFQEKKKTKEEKREKKKEVEKEVSDEGIENESDVESDDDVAEVIKHQKNVRSKLQIFKSLYVVNPPCSS